MSLSTLPTLPTLPTLKALPTGSGSGGGSVVVPVPGIPTIAVTSSTGQASVVITPADANATSFNILRGTSANSLTLLTNTTSTTYVDNTVTNGNVFYYGVVAVGSSGNSAQSTVANAYIPFAAAAAYTATFTGSQQGSVSGRIQLPNVTFANSMDGTLLISTKEPVASSSTDYTSSFPFSAAPALSNTALTDSSSLNIAWTGQYISQWNGGNFKRAWSLFAVDSAGLNASSRAVGQNWNVTPGSATTQITTPPAQFSNGGSGQGEGGVCTIAVRVKSGQISFAKVTSRGVENFDNLGYNRNWVGFSNVPALLGGPSFLAANTGSTPRQWWGQPVQTLVVKNGLAASDDQLERIHAGADPRSVFSMSSATNDLYFNGQISGTSFVELISGSNGTIITDASGTSGISQAGTSILPTSVNDNVKILDAQEIMMFPKQLTALRIISNTIRIPMRRVGVTSNVQVQLVVPGSTFPASGANILVPWQTVGANIANNTTFAAFVTGVPDLTAFDLEVRWDGGTGTYGTAVRAGITAMAGFLFLTQGQSIVQKFVDNSGNTVAFPASINQGVYACYNRPDNASYNTLYDQFQLSGWQRRFSSSANYGVNRMSVAFAQLTGMAIGVLPSAIGSQSTTAWTSNGGVNEPRLRAQQNLWRFAPQHIMWENGQADAGGTNVGVNDTQANRWAQLDQILAQVDSDIAAAPGGGWKYTYSLKPLTDDISSSDAYPENIREWDMAWVVSRMTLSNCPSSVQTNGNLLGVFQESCTFDAALLDATHPDGTDNGYGRIADTRAMDYAYFIGKQAYAGYGGKITGATYSVSSGLVTLNLPIALNGGTALTLGGGTAPPPVEVSIDNGSWTVITGWGLSSNQQIFVGTISGNPTTSVKIRYLNQRPLATTYSPGQQFFTASISGTTMSVTALTGSLSVGQVVQATAGDGIVTKATKITAVPGGGGSSGATGSYTVSISQTVSSQSMNTSISRYNAFIDNLIYDNRTATLGVLNTVSRISTTGFSTTGVVGFPVEPLGAGIAATLGTTVAIGTNTSTVAVTTPATTTQLAATTILGTYTGVVPQALTYTFDGGAYVAAGPALISNFTASGGTWSGKFIAPSGAGSHTISVFDPATFGSVTAASGSFTVNAAPMPTQVQVQSFNNTSNANPVTAAFATAPTAGNTITMLRQTYTGHQTVPSGFSVLASSSPSGASTLFYDIITGPVSAYPAGGFTIDKGIGGGWIIETTGQFNEGSNQDFTALNSTSINIGAPAAQSHALAGALRYVLLEFYEASNAAITVTAGGTLIGQTAGNNGNGGTILISVPDQSTTAITCTSSTNISTSNKLNFASYLT